MNRDAQRREAHLSAPPVRARGVKVEQGLVAKGADGGHRDVAVDATVDDEPLLGGCQAAQRVGHVLRMFSLHARLQRWGPNIILIHGATPTPKILKYCPIKLA